MTGSEPYAKGCRYDRHEEGLVYEGCTLGKCSDVVGVSKRCAAGRVVGCACHNKKGRVPEFNLRSDVAKVVPDYAAFTTMCW